LALPFQNNVTGGGFLAENLYLFADKKLAGHHEFMV
jgi:hypothetical protein